MDVLYTGAQRPRRSIWAPAFLFFSSLNNKIDEFNCITVNSFCCVVCGESLHAYINMGTSRICSYIAQDLLYIRKRTLKAKEQGSSSLWVLGVHFLSRSLSHRVVSDLVTQLYLVIILFKSVSIHLHPAIHFLNPLMLIRLHLLTLGHLFSLKRTLLLFWFSSSAASRFRFYFHHFESNMFEIVLEQLVRCYNRWPVCSLDIMPCPIAVRC